MFETKYDRPMWRIVYEHAVTLNVGDILTYDKLAELLPDASEQTRRGALARAVKQIEDDKQRTLANVRLVGYRVVEAKEHEGLARSHHKRSKRQLVKAARKVCSADRSKLSEADKRRFDALELNLTAQLQMIRRLDDRVTANEVALKDARRQTASSLAVVSDKVERLEAVLRRAGLTVKETA